MDSKWKHIKQAIVCAAVLAACTVTGVWGQPYALGSVVGLGIIAVVVTS